MEEAKALIEELMRRLGAEGSKKLVKGLKLAVKLGDPAMIYHQLGMLYPEYYGKPLKFSFPGYTKKYPGARRVKLPKPARPEARDLFQVLLTRRSRREYSDEPLDLQTVSTLLYYSFGITGRAWWGGPKRAFPSAGALQPVEAYISAHRVSGLEKGIYHYNPAEGSLETLREGDYREELYRASLEQYHVASAPLTIIVTGVYSRTASKYMFRSYRYIHWDVGFAGQNIYLVAEALQLATTAVGAFYDGEICGLLGIDCVTEIPMLLFPVGKRHGSLDS